MFGAERAFEMPPPHGLGIFLPAQRLQRGDPEVNADAGVVLVFEATARRIQPGQRNFAEPGFRPRLAATGTEAALAAEAGSSTLRVRPSPIDFASTDRRSA